MKIHSLIIVIVTIFAFSCSHTDKIPQGVYDTKKMEKVMWDMMLADRYAWLIFQKDSVRPNAKLKTFKMYEDVFKIHKTTSEAFLRSYKYYLTRPDLTKIIFDSMSNKANRSRSSMTGDFKVK